MAVSSAPPNFLVPAVERFRETSVDDSSKLVVIDPEPERRSCHHNVVSRTRTYARSQTVEDLSPVRASRAARHNRDTSKPIRPKALHPSVGLFRTRHI